MISYCLTWKHKWIELGRGCTITAVMFPVAKLACSLLVGYVLCDSHISSWPLIRPLSPDPSRSPSDVFLNAAYVRNLSILERKTKI